VTERLRILPLVRRFIIEQNKTLDFSLDPFRINNEVERKLGLYFSFEEFAQRLQIWIDSPLQLQY
jgi:hypothetical protein